MNKKVVWLPYDFDTALGINNEGALTFSYNLEDTDYLIGGADVYNGQESVIWNNMREAFGKEIKEMYQRLRSEGKLSYSVVENAFESHQDKWGEAIFNEDSYFKYLAPLIAPEDGAQPTAAYLSMLQGSKKEQRKWWLYNRFRYMDSKYNAGDALSDVIQLRGYAKDNITITPYADVYASIKYGSYLVQERGERNVPSTLICPLTTVNDTEIYIYSASQLSQIGDLSGLKVGFADFSNGTKLSALKVGDASSNYENPNLKELYVGTNGLLQTIDVRNCTALGTDKQSAIDLSGCGNIENVYFDNTAVKGVVLPNGGILKVLHLPSTVTNLTIQNQNAITDFTMPSYSNITTLRLENTSIDARPILNNIPAASRVRLIDFYWECEDAEEIEDILSILDTMRGLDESGNNTETAQLSGTIHTNSLTGEQIESFNSRYPYLNVIADHTSCTLRYYNYDGTTLLNEETIIDGGNGTWPTQPTRPATPANTFTFVGWSLNKNQSVADSNATKNVSKNRNIYAAYTATGRTYTVRFYNEGMTLLQTVNNVPYGGTATYTGSTPVHPSGDTETYEFNGWSPSNINIQGETNCVAQYKDLSSKARGIIQKTLKNVENNEINYIRPYAFGACRSLTTVSFPNVTSIDSHAFEYCNSLTTANFTQVENINNHAFYACNKLTNISMPEVTVIGPAAFCGCSSLTSINCPKIETIGNAAFSSCASLTTINISNVTFIDSCAFYRCSKLTSVNLPKISVIPSLAFNVCVGLTTVTAPNVTSILTSAFAVCDNLTSIDCSQTTLIGTEAFRGCFRLTSVNFPNVLSISASAFTNCSALISVDFPNVTNIGSSAFSNCASLTTVKLSNVTNIGSYAFYSCSKLMSVYLLNSMVLPYTSHILTNTPIFTSTYTGSFGSIYVPASLVDSYKTANGWSSYSSRIVAYT